MNGQVTNRTARGRAGGPAPGGPVGHLPVHRQGGPVLSCGLRAEDSWMRVETSTVQQVQQLTTDLHNQHQGSMKGSCTCCTDPRAPVIQDLVFPMVYPQPGSTGGTGRQRRTELHWNVRELADDLGSRRWRYTCPTSTGSTR